MSHNKIHDIVSTLDHSVDASNANSLIVTDPTSNFLQYLNPGTAGLVLTSAGPSSPLIWSSGAWGSGTLNYVAKWTPNGTVLGNSLIFDNGTEVGIGTASPTALVHISGASGATLRIVDTNQGVGKVLTSDANGNSSWQTSASSGIQSLNGLTVSSQTFGNDTNVIIVSSGSVHQIEWAGLLSISRGGTNNSTAPTSGAVAYGTGSAYGFTSVGTTGQILTSQGSGTPIWTNASGGTGTVTSFSSGNLNPLFSTSVSTQTTTPALSFALNTQTANTVLAGPTTGSAAAPTFRALISSDIPLIPLATGVSGVLPIANGGTNSASSPTSGAVAYGTGISYAFTSVGVIGQVLVSQGASAPIWSSSPTPTGTADTVAYFNGSGVLSDSTAFTFNGSEVGIGTSSPGYLLDVNGVIHASANILSGVPSSTPGRLVIYDGTTPYYTSFNSSTSETTNQLYTLPAGLPSVSGYVLSSTTGGIMSWVASGAGSGTVTSVSSGNLSPLFTVSVATPTTTPSISFTLNTQTANTVFAGPTTGSAAQPTFRTLVTADLPSGTATASGTANYVAKFSSSTAIEDSLIYDSGTSVGIGTNSPTATLSVKGAGTTSSTLTASFQNSTGTSNSLIILDSGQVGVGLTISQIGGSGANFQVQGTDQSHLTAAFAITDGTNANLFIVWDDGSARLGGGGGNTQDRFQIYCPSSVVGNPLVVYSQQVEGQMTIENTNNGLGMYMTVCSTGASRSLWVDKAVLSPGSGTNTPLLFNTFNPSGISPILFGANGTFTYAAFVPDPSTSSGQLGIGTVTPDASSILDLESTTLGFLPPQMTTTQKNAIVSPKEGLVVYDLTAHTLYYWNGSAWTAV